MKKGPAIFLNLEGKGCKTILDLHIKEIKAIVGDKDSQ